MKRLFLGLAVVLLGTLCIFWFRSSTNTYTGGDLSPRKLTLDRMFQVARSSSQYQKLAGCWPTNTALLAATVGIADASLLEDGWGRPFVLYTDSAGKVLFILSYGSDGESNGDGENSDLVWTLDKPIP